MIPSLPVYPNSTWEEMQFSFLKTNEKKNMKNYHN